MSAVISASDAATTAIFQLQMSSEKAIRFVRRNSRVDERTANEAVKNAAIWYKLPNR